MRRLTVDADLTEGARRPRHGLRPGPGPATETGPAELVLLTEDDVVLQLRVDAKAPVDVTSHLRARRNAQEAW